MQRRSLIFVVVTILAVALVCSSGSTGVFAVPPDPGFQSSKDCTTKYPDDVTVEMTCCWRERVPGQILGKEYCQTCKSVYGGQSECTEKKPQALEQPPASSPFDPTAPIQGGVLEQQTPPTFSPGNSPGVLEQLEQGEGFSPGFLQQQQEQSPGDQGAAQFPPATDGSQPATVEEEQPVVPVCQEGLEFNDDLGFCVPTECPEGQELNEETGICVLEEQPAAAEEPEEQQQTEEQPSEESDSEVDNDNN